MEKNKTRHVLCSNQKTMQYASVLAEVFEEAAELHITSDCFEMIWFTEGEHGTPLDKGNLDIFAFDLADRWVMPGNRNELQMFLNREHLTEVVKQGHRASVTCRETMMSQKIGWIRVDITPVEKDTLLLTLRRFCMRESELLEVLMDQLILEKSDQNAGMKDAEKAFLLGKVMDESKRDSLTRLYNRKTLGVLVNHALEKEVRRAVLLFIDLDNFKEINDRYGHLTGDCVLKSAASILCSCVSDVDVVGRVGGDEFIMFLPDLNFEAEKMENRVKKICGLIHEKLSKSDFVIPLTCSIGGAHYPKDGRDYMTLAGRADEALYCAKRKGKNCSVFCNEDVIY